MNEITQKWLVTGLLDQIDENQQDEMARILDTIAIKLIAAAPPNDTPEKGKHEQFCGIILPTARKVFEELEGELSDVEGFYEYCKDGFYEKGGDLLVKDLNSYISLDGEREYCCLLCEHYVENVKKIKENKI